MRRQARLRTLLPLFAALAVVPPTSAHAGDGAELDLDAEPLDFAATTDVWKTNETLHHVVAMDGTLTVFFGPATGARWVQVLGHAERSLQGMGAGNVQSVVAAWPYVAWRGGVVDTRTGSVWPIEWPSREGPRAGWQGVAYGISGTNLWGYDIAANRSLDVSFGGNPGKPADAPDVNRLVAAGPLGLVVGTDFAQFLWHWDGSWARAPVSMRVGACGDWLSARSAPTIQLAREAVTNGSLQTPWNVTTHRVYTLHAAADAWAVLMVDGDVEPAETFVMTGDCNGSWRAYNLTGGPTVQGVWVWKSGLLLRVGNRLAAIDPEAPAVPLPPLPPPTPPSPPGPATPTGSQAAPAFPVAIALLALAFAARRRRQDASPVPNGQLS